MVKLPTQCLQSETVGNAVVAKSSKYTLPILNAKETGPEAGHIERQSSERAPRLIISGRYLTFDSQQPITPRSDGNSLMPSCQHSVIQRHLRKSSTYTAGNPNASRDQGASRPPDGVTSCHPV
ncbi:hypothetical protein FOXG_17717 [Fusarium oxysporum f. sp. lycopersici 4287]|uniref:Uncharacterized protein n=2 Tax=Fusarium oxysporum TaxID=5507 RepID=A0A0J9WW78_FUSO4|nr:uncharacterized protein FOXG_17717 [Fusarium oxysporum f. sp. lycopersici 4287]KNB20807.1 hypothetical protein FOXG_17717 [Fusarium oxysporum f. sp. lycopersici 4287]